MSTYWPWITLALLGAYHGINPGMGWLFAVSLGLQERSRAAVIRAFAPIAIGHFISIAAVVALVWALQYAIDPAALRYAGATVLIGYGIYKLVAPMSHPRWVGMRVGSRQLALWSFLMATAHGAGLMVVPIVLKMSPPRVANATASVSADVRIEPVSYTEKKPACHVEGAATADASSKKNKSDAPESKSDAVPSCHAQIGQMAGGGGRAGIASAMAGVGLHTLAMFLAMGGIALLVYDRIGLRILRTGWYNLDLVWAVALIGAGALTLAL
jgi:hypothetical protein